MIAFRSRRVYVDGRLRPATVLLEGQRISGVLAHGECPPGTELHDYGDLVISPGFLDLHVHLNDPGNSDWEGFETGTRAAAAGGITTLVDMPLNSLPVTTSKAALAQKATAARFRTAVDVGFHGGVIGDFKSDIVDLLRAGVVGMKAFLIDSGLLEFPPATGHDLRAVMPLLAKAGVPLLVHAELSIEASVSTDFSTLSSWAASRPAAMEVEALQLLIALVRETGCPVHIVHLAAKECVPLLKAAQSKGLPITAETCPHYLAFALGEVPETDTLFKCAPPIRDAANREALWKAIDEGVITTIGSDHSPCPPSMKRQGEADFGRAWGGISGLQLLFPAFWTEAKRRGFRLDQILPLFTSNPARLIGREDLGRITPGAWANLAILDDQAKFTVQPASLFHRHAISPWIGRELRGVVRETWLRGSRVYPATHEQPRGTLLLAPRTPPPNVEQLLTCCGSRRWAEAMFKAWPEPPFLAAERIADTLTQEDWLEAFSHHPRIGDIAFLQERFPATHQLSSSEQAAAASAREETLHALKHANDLYFERFGYIFIVCATGKSAEEMLAILRSRLDNDPSAELQIAAREQRKITRIRLEKLLL
jgi:allantoinase